MNPNLPKQPEEIIESAYECYNEGATIVHIHGRDKTGENTSNPEVLKKIREGIREKCNLIIQYSTGGGPDLTQEQRIECLETTPEMASLNMGSLMRISGNYASIAWSNMPNEIEMYVSRMRKLGVKPEMEVYNLAMFPMWRKSILDATSEGSFESSPNSCIKTSIWHYLQVFRT